MSLPRKNAPALVLAICLLLCFTEARLASAAQVRPGAPVFDDAPFVAAAKRAAGEGKFLIALFSGDWVAAETKLKDDVLRDKRITAAIANRFVAVRVDAIRDQNVMRQFHVRALPTLIVFNDKGAELARWADVPMRGGMPKADALARDLSAILKSGLPLSETNPPDAKDRSNKIFKLAVAYDRSGAYPVALKTYLLALDALYSERNNSDFNRIFRSADSEDIFYGIAGMREKFPAADAAIREKRDSYMVDIAAGREAFALKTRYVVDINRALHDEDAAIKFFENAPPDKPRVREEFRFDAFVALVDKQDYAKAAGVIPPAEAIALAQEKNGMATFSFCKALFPVVFDDGSEYTDFGGDTYGVRVVEEWTGGLCLLEAFAGVGDAQTSAAIARAIISGKDGKKKPDPELVAYAHATVRRARAHSGNSDGDAFARAIGLPLASGTEGISKQASASAPDSKKEPAGQDKDKGADKGEGKVVNMPALVVTAKPFGIIPFGYEYWVKGIFGKTLVVPLRIWNLRNFKNTDFPRLESLGAKNGEFVVAIDGKAVIGRTAKATDEFWYHGGDAGDKVKLTLQGSGKDESIFHEVTVKRIGYPNPNPSSGKDGGG